MSWAGNIAGGSGNGEQPWKGRPQGGATVFSPTLLGRCGGRAGGRKDKGASRQLMVGGALVESLAAKVAKPQARSR